MGDVHPWDVFDPDGGRGMQLRDVRLVPGRKLIATLWSTGACAGGLGASSGDMLALISLRGGSPVVRLLGQQGRSACAFLESVTPDVIQLRSVDGMPYNLSLYRGKGGMVQLSGR